MADKLTLLELHLHAEDNEFESDMEFSSDIGELLRDRLGFGSDEEETDEFGIGDEDEDDSLSSIGTADGGDTMEIGGETEEMEEAESESAVVEIDRDSDLVDEDEEDEGGRSWGRVLLVFVLLVAVAYLARSYLGGDDFEDEFEEL